MNKSANAKKTLGWVIRPACNWSSIVDFAMRAAKRNEKREWYSGSNIAFSSPRRKGLWYLIHTESCCRILGKLTLLAGQTTEWSVMQLEVVGTTWQLTSGTMNPQLLGDSSARCDLSKRIGADVCLHGLQRWPKEGGVGRFPKGPWQKYLAVSFPWPPLVGHEQASCQPSPHPGLPAYHNRGVLVCVGKKAVWLNVPTGTHTHLVCAAGKPKDWQMRIPDSAETTIWNFRACKRATTMLFRNSGSAGCPAWVPRAWQGR